METSGVGNSAMLCKMRNLSNFLNFSSAEAFLKVPRDFIRFPSFLAKLMANTTVLNYKVACFKALYEVNSHLEL